MACQYDKTGVTRLYIERSGQIIQMSNTSRVSYSIITDAEVHDYSFTCRRDNGVFVDGHHFYVAGNQYTLSKRK